MPLETEATEPTNDAVTYGTDQHARPERTAIPEAPSETMSPAEFVAARGDAKSLLMFEESALAYFGDRAPEGPEAIRQWEGLYPERCG
jgi:hypothetical protein